MLSNEFEIRQMNLRSRFDRQRVERFLADNGLRLDEVDKYFCIFRLEEEEILAGGGLAGDVIKCVAVRSDMREEGLFNHLVSHLISVAFQHGHTTTKVFTKPANEAIFASLGYNFIGRAPQAILMANSLSPLNRYKRYLREKAALVREARALPASENKPAAVSAATTADSSSPFGLVMMNANPFTDGHRYLIEQAARQVDALFVIVVKENLSRYDYRYRFEMVAKGCLDLSNVLVLEGSEFQISSATFPTYFLKRLDDASDEQMLLDLDICTRHIMPALGANLRFVGSEPIDPLTRRYNELMQQSLSSAGMKLVEIPRLQRNGEPISASMVRRKADLTLLPASSVPYFIGVEAANAMFEELRLTPKPGLIDQHDNGAHTDMNYRLMERSISALEPFLVRLARIGFAPQLPSTEAIVDFGIEAEGAMLEATHGVNTHKGAFFALGLAALAFHHKEYKRRNHEAGSEQSLSELIAEISSGIPRATNTHGARVRQLYGVRGALDLAREGYPELFTSWLPDYRLHRDEPLSKQRLLLNIMATLDDTNLLHRRGPEPAAEVKRRAAKLLESPLSLEALTDLNAWMLSENLSPGGCADMLALTLFVDRLSRQE